MHILQSLVTVTILTSTVVSAPARPKREGRSFKIPRVRRADYTPHGPTALRKAYRKFGFHSSNPFIASSSAPRINAASNNGTDEAGEVSATPQQGDVEFLSPVSVGGQTLMMNFDTGSSDLYGSQPEPFIDDTNPALVGSSILSYPSRQRKATLSTTRRNHQHSKYFKARRSTFLT